MKLQYIGNVPIFDMYFQTPTSVYNKSLKNKTIIQFIKLVLGVSINEQQTILSKIFKVEINYVKIKVAFLDGIVFRL